MGHWGCLAQLDLRVHQGLPHIPEWAYLRRRKALALDPNPVQGLLENQGYLVQWDHQDFQASEVKRERKGTKALGESPGWRDQ